MQVLFTLLVIIAPSACLQHTSLYVKPDYLSSSSCPDQPCLTLEQYASQQTKYFTTGATFLFLAGNHSISTQLILRSISDVTLLAFNDDSNVTVFFKTAGVIEIQEAANFSIVGMTIVLHASLDALEPAILGIFFSRNVSLLNVTFVRQVNLQVRKGAINCTRSSVVIYNCHFEGLIGNGAMYANHSIVSLSENVFYRNSAAYLGGACHFSACNVTLKGNIFLHNEAGIRGGALFLDNGSSVVFKEELGNTFMYNFAKRSGGAVDCFYCTIVEEKPNMADFSSSIEEAHQAVQTKATFPHTTYFSNNQAGLYGGAIDFFSSVSSVSGFAVFYNNSAQLGGGISVLVGSTVNFTSSIWFEENEASRFGGAVYMDLKSTLSLNGCAHEFKGNIAYLYGGAIFATSSAFIIVNNTVSFVGNHAKQDGGALYFVSGARLTMAQRAHLLLSRNHADNYGGAIFHEDAITPEQCRFTSIYNEVDGIPGCFLDFKPYLATNSQNLYLSSDNNTAGKGGSFLFGGLLDKCLVIAFDSSNFNRIPLYQILIKKVVNTSTECQPILSKPYKLCFCGSTHEYDCTKEISIRTYRGVTFTVPLLALAQGDTVTSSPVRAIVKHSARLLPNQRSQDLLPNCTGLPFNMLSTEENEQLILYLDGGPCSDIGLSRAVVNVTLLPCPDAFTLSGDQCVCEERLQAYNASCSIVSNSKFYITRKAGSSFWVNAIMKSGKHQGLVLCPVCPMEYCRSAAVNISLTEPDIQCDYNRSGVLCGACRANYSLTFGSSTCELCSNAHLALLLPFAAAGIALVVFLTVLRLTVATGAINSIILYANIVQANKNTLFFSSSSSSIFSVFIAWLNLDLGFHSCFYNGMDAYAQTWLQLAFPLYVWILISLIILASRHSMTVTKLIGSNPIAVLATLLLMSYTKLLKIVIEVFSSIDLEYPGNETVTVWLKDANVPYLQTWHLALTVVVTLLLVFLFLPYTLLLLLGYKLYRFTGQKYSQWLVCVKPLLESYYAPYRMHTRYWTGFLLLIRCTLYIVFSYNSLGHATHSRFSIIIAFLAIIILLSFKVYSKLLVNSLEVIVYSNLIVLSAAPLASYHSPLLVDVLVGMVFVIMMGVITYHFYTYCISSSIIWLKACKKMKGLGGKPTETTPLLAPVANAKLSQRVSADRATPTRKPTQSVFSIGKVLKAVSEHPTC